MQYSSQQTEALTARPPRICILDGETINVETLKGMLGETGVAARRDGHV
ncbi:MAG: hypothetical protein AB9872_13600 [Solidesulfovibrio sp.]